MKIGPADSRPQRGRCYGFERPPHRPLPPPVLAELAVQVLQENPGNQALHAPRHSAGVDQSSPVKRQAHPRRVAKRLRPGHAIRNSKFEIRRSETDRSSSLEGGRSRGCLPRPQAAPPLLRILCAEIPNVKPSVVSSPWPVVRCQKPKF